MFSVCNGLLICLMLPWLAGGRMTWDGLLHKSDNWQDVGRGLVDWDTLALLGVASVPPAGQLRLTHMVMSGFQIHCINLHKSSNLLHQKWRWACQTHTADYSFVSVFVFLFGAHNSKIKLAFIFLCPECAIPDPTFLGSARDGKLDIGNCVLDVYHESRDLSNLTIGILQA